MQQKTSLKSKKLSGAKGRLLEYLNYYGIKKADFYRATSLGNGFLDKNDNIGSDNIEIIISKFPDINLSWLVTGNGEMLTSSPVNTGINQEFIEKIYALFESRENEHKTILGQNSEIIKQNSDIIKQNSEVMRQNGELIKIVAKFIEK